MKKIISFILFISMSLFVSAQNTWVRKLSYITQQGGYNDTLTGIKDVEVGTDGSVFVLAHTDQHNVQRVFKFFPNSNQVEWTIDVAFDGSQVDSWVDVIKATSDSGLLVCYNENYISNHGAVRKYSKAGILEWTRGFIDIDNGTDRLVSDAIEKSPGIYYALRDDSMFTLDNAGNIIDSTGLIHGTCFIQATNGDLLVRENNFLNRVDTSGNVIWTQTCTGAFDYDTSNVFIQTSSWFVQKVNAYTGVQLWNRSYVAQPISHIEATHDGGFMASVGYEPTGSPFWWTNAVASPGYLFRADSLGDTLWTRTFLLPHYGLYSFAIIPGGNILTGGCYLSGTGEYPDYFKNYSAFCCMLNQDASYPLLQTSYVSPPDADNDHFRNFASDALAAMLALGNTGTPVDTSVDLNGPYGYFACGLLNLATDWLTSSAGINHKYSDFDGNGIVDTNDLNAFSNIYMCEDSIQLYYRMSNPENGIQNIEELCFTPVNDTILPGDELAFYITMGSNNNPVDSIYGFAITYFIGETGMDHVDSSRFYTSGLGTPGQNIWTHQNAGFVTINNLTRYHTLVCRTDFQNATNVSDTIGVVYFGGYYSSSTINLTIADFKAILADGSSIPFNVCAGSIFIDSSSVSVNEKEEFIFKISPNPANELLTISFSNSTYKNIVLMNALGEKMKEIKSSEKNAKISIADLPNGFYFGTVSSGEALKKFSFVVQH